MKSISDAWTIYRAQVFSRCHGMDPRARAEIERAFFAGAESVVDDLQDVNDAGLTFPFDVARQLTRWGSELIAHQRDHQP